MKKIKILHVIRPAMGGMKNHLLSLAQNVREDMFESVVACPEGPMAKELQAMNIKTLPIDLKGELSPIHDQKTIVILRKYLQEQQVDIMHAHGSKAGLVGRLAGLWAKTPVILFTAHNSIFYDQWPGWKKSLYANMERLLAQKTKKIIAVSQALRDEILLQEKVAPHKVEVIYNGIDPGKFPQNPMKKSVLASLGIINDTLPLVGTVARLAPQKGVSFFIKAAALLSRNINAQFIIIGDGPLRAELEKEAKALGLQEQLIFAGHRNDVHDILPCMDIMVLPSLTEGLPLGLLEAMAAARPVVATKVGGIPEAVLDRVTGVLVPPEDELSLVQGIQELLSYREKAEAMGQEGRKRILDQFTLQLMVEKTQTLYLHLCREIGGGDHC